MAFYSLDPAILISKEKYLNDNLWHSISGSILFNDSYVVSKQNATIWCHMALEVDSKRVSTKKPIYLPSFLAAQFSLLPTVAFLGGSEKSIQQFSAFQGCIASLEINEKLIDLNLYAKIAAKNLYPNSVTLGNCGPGILGTQFILNF